MGQFTKYLTPYGNVRTAFIDMFGVELVTESAYVDKKTESVIVRGRMMSWWYVVVWTSCRLI